MNYQNYIDKVAYAIAVLVDGVALSAHRNLAKLMLIVPRVTTGKIKKMPAVEFKLLMAGAVDGVQEQ